MSCKECPYASKRTVENIIRPGSIAFVGESPGKTEVQQGEPFVGESGQLLEALLVGVGLKKEDVSLLNACRCMLDKTNIKEANTALKRCKEYLLRDLEKAKPPIIVALGDVAMGQLTGRKGISKQRGRLIQAGGYTILPTFHPSFLLRRGARSKDASLFRSVLADIKTALEGSSHPSPPDRFAGYKQGTPKDVEELLSAPILAVDAEFVSETSELLCVGFSSKPGYARVFFPEDKESIAKLLSSGIPKIVAARPADEHIFQDNGLEVKGRIFDVLTMAHVLDENLPKYSLEEVANIYSSLRGIKDVAEGQRGNLKEADRALVLRYNGTDCDATLQCYNSMKRELLGNASLGRYYARFMVPIQNTFVEVSRAGIPISLRRLREVEQILEQEKKRSEAAAIKRIPKSIREAHAPKVKLTRSELIRDYLFRHPDGLKLKPVKFTAKTLVPSTDEEHLSRFSSFAFVRHLLRWRKADKLVSTYIRNLYKYYDNGKVYPRIDFTRTVTGRTAMSKPNFQNYPKRGEFASILRSIIEAPEGWVMGECDLSQSELRIIGWLAHDPNILGALRQGIDLHSFTASIALGKPVSDVTKEERQKAKAINFGFIYGMSAEGFVQYAESEYGVKTSLAEAKEFRNRFFSKPNGYYMLPAYHARCIAQAKTYGWVQQPLGRRRRLANINGKDTWERSRAERQAINFPVQAFSSDLALIGLMLFHQQVRHRSDIMLVSFIHDSVVFMATEDSIEEAAHICVGCMTEGAPEYIQDKFGIEVGYPVEAEAKIGKSLAKMEVLL